MTCYISHDLPVPSLLLLPVGRLASVSSSVTLGFGCSSTHCVPGAACRVTTWLQLPQAEQHQNRQKARVSDRNTTATDLTFVMNFLPQQYEQNRVTEAVKMVVKWRCRPFVIPYLLDNLSIPCSVISLLMLLGCVVWHLVISFLVAFVLMDIKLCTFVKPSPTFKVLHISGDCLHPQCGVFSRKADTVWS